MQTDFPIPIDAKWFLKLFVEVCEGVRVDCHDWLKQCKKWQKKYPVCLPEYWDETGHVNNYVFIDVLSDVLPEGTLIVPGSSGGCSEVTMQAFKIKKGMRMFNSEGLGPMGFGIPAAIGGCIAAGKKETICIDGDGGFVMNIQELETVRRLNLPIKFFVLNNQGYASIRMTQNTHFNKHLVASDESSGLTLPPLNKNAETYSIPYYKISNHDNIHSLIQEVVDQEGPVICEVMLPFTHITAPKASVYKKEDGSFAAKPMEDLAPFLDRDEFKENMISEIEE